MYNKLVGANQNLCTILQTFTGKSERGYAQSAYIRCFLSKTGLQGQILTFQKVGDIMHFG